MATVSWDLRELTDALVEEVMKRLKEASIEQYRDACNRLIRHAAESGATEWSPEVSAAYLGHIDERLEGGTMCKGYHRFQRRVLRMLGSLALTGEVDFSAAPRPSRRYPVSEEVARMVEEILGAQRISDKARSDVRAPVRHLLWYAAERGVAPLG